MRLERIVFYCVHLAELGELHTARGTPYKYLHVKPILVFTLAKSPHMGVGHTGVRKPRPCKWHSGQTRGVITREQFDREQSNRSGRHGAGLEACSLVVGPRRRLLDASLVSCVGIERRVWLVVRHYC